MLALTKANSCISQNNTHYPECKWFAGLEARVVYK